MYHISCGLFWVIPLINITLFILIIPDEWLVIMLVHAVRVWSILEDDGRLMISDDPANRFWNIYHCNGDAMTTVSDVGECNWMVKIKDGDN